jgi:deoxyribonucleoside regulator
MPSNQRDELHQMITAARLYYEDGITQEDIAKEMGISRPTISRLLQRAKEEGIVQISILDPFDTDEDIADQLVTKCSLQKAIVIPNVPNRVDLTMKRLGLATSHFLEQILMPDEVIGVGWGRTLHAVSQSLTHTLKRELLAVPLLGGLGQISPNFQVHEITRSIAAAFDGAWKQFYVPALVNDPATWKNLYGSSDVQELVKTWEVMTTALVGIGNVDFDAEMQMLFAQYLDEKTRAKLRAGGAVGDICMRFFDVNGREVAGLEGIIGISLEQLRRVPRIIAVASGVEKAEAIIGALNGNMIDVLITDVEAAKRIITLTGRV